MSGTAEKQALLYKPGIALSGKLSEDDAIIANRDGGEKRDIMSDQIQARIDARIASQNRFGSQSLTETAPEFTLDWPHGHMTRDGRDILILDIDRSRSAQISFDRIH